jgi:glucokinase-like ROK family protein
LELNPNAGYIVSAEIGVDFVLVVRANFAGQIVWRFQETTSPGMGQEQILERVLDGLGHAVDLKPEQRARLLGLAVGVPGLIDQETGALLFAPNLGWENVELYSILQQHFNVPIFVDNEANLAALGEYYFGAAEGCDEVLYISAGVGLGGGIVRNGYLFKGATGFAGEFGHMTTNPNGLPCNCGNVGCWETEVSQAALFRYIRQAIERGRSTILPQMVHGDLYRLSVGVVVEAARQGDGLAQEAFDVVGHHLGVGIANLVNALNPKRIVFGGILSLGWDYLLPAVQAELQRRALRWNESAAQIVLARHGFDACVMGGIATVYYAILTQPSEMARQVALA